MRDLSPSIAGLSECNGNRFDRAFYLVVLFISVCGCVFRENPWQVVRYYGPAYLTAVGTMSSAATLPVALKSAKKVLYSKEKWSILPFLCLLTFIYVVLY